MRAGATAWSPMRAAVTKGGASVSADRGSRRGATTSSPPSPPNIRSPSGEIVAEPVQNVVMPAPCGARSDVIASVDGSIRARPSSVLAHTWPSASRTNASTPLFGKPSRTVIRRNRGDPSGRVPLCTCSPWPSVPTHRRPCSSTRRPLVRPPGSAMGSRGSTGSCASAAPDRSRRKTWPLVPTHNTSFRPRANARTCVCPSSWSRWRRTVIGDTPAASSAHSPSDPPSQSVGPSTSSAQTSAVGARPAMAMRSTRLPSGALLYRPPCVPIQMSPFGAGAIASTRARGKEVCGCAGSGSSALALPLSTSMIWRP